MRIFLIVILTVFSLYASADERRALRLLEKRDYEKLEEVLEKDIEKDSINPGAYYIYSLLYNDPFYPGADLDTAYRFIRIAQKMYPEIDERDREKLDRFDINDSTMQVQKQRIEYLAFEKTKSEHSLPAYNYYIENFPGSRYRTEAIEARNELAFRNAERENTYQSYHKFLQTYPESSQADMAREKYDRLLYEGQTRDGKLESYQDFIIKFPESPFVPEALQKIYQLRTLDNREESLLKFIQDFPASPHASDAIDRLYYNYREKGDMSFSYYYDFLSLSDSIRDEDRFAEDHLFPVYENGSYGFMTSRGDLLIPYSVSDIEISYLCGDIVQDFLVVEKNDEQVILSKTGRTIYDGNFYNVEDLGYGLLKISNYGRYGLIFKTGKTILPTRYEEIVRLDDQLLKARDEKGWALFSFNGLMLVEDRFQEIEKEGEFLLLRKDYRWAVTNAEEIFSSFNEKNKRFSHRFDDYELIEPVQLLCFQGKKETVMDKDLKLKLPLQEQEIFAMPEGWLVRQDSLYHLYDDAFYKISGSGFSQVEYKGKWITGQTDKRWILYYNFAPFPDVFSYDSVNILSDYFVVVFNDQEPNLVFPSLEKENINNYERLIILEYQSKSGDPGEVPEFLQVIFDNGRKVVFNKNGKTILKGNYDEIQAIGPEYIRLKRRNQVGLADTSGHILLKPQFDGIANYNEGYVSVLDNRQFGLYNRHLGLYLKPEYSRIVRPFHHHYYIAYKNDGYGLVNGDGEALTEMRFEEINYWNDTSMMVKENGFWHLYDLVNNEMIVEDIYDFDFLKDSEEKIILFNKENLYGVISNKTGFIINHTFNDIINLGDQDKPVFFAEKYIPEAEFYIVIYYDREGNILKKQVFDDEEYDKIYCN